MFGEWILGERAGTSKESREVGYSQTDQCKQNGLTSLPGHYLRGFYNLFVPHSPGFDVKNTYLILHPLQFVYSMARLCTSCRVFFTSEIL